MMQNNPKQKKNGFDPFLLSLLTENKMDPMLSLMMTTNKDMSKMGPLLPLFFTGKTNKDPLLMQMLMTQQALPGWVLTVCFFFKISLKNYPFEIIEKVSRMVNLKRDRQKIRNSKFATYASNDVEFVRLRWIKVYMQSRPS